MRVIVVEKDLNEIRVLRSHFQESRVLICLFHVVKCLGAISRKPEFGKIAEEIHCSIDHIVHNMIYAPSKEMYEQGRRNLRLMCDRIDFTGFYKYMEKNWHSFVDMWVMCRRAKLAHYKNRTKTVA